MYPPLNDGATRRRLFFFRNAVAYICGVGRLTGDLPQGLLYIQAGPPNPAWRRDEASISIVTVGTIPG
jgi:hypothetical protein